MKICFFESIFPIDGKASRVELIQHILGNCERSSQDIALDPGGQFSSWLGLRNSQVVVTKQKSYESQKYGSSSLVEMVFMFHLVNDFTAKHSIVVFYVPLTILCIHILDCLASYSDNQIVNLSPLLVAICFSFKRSWELFIDIFENG